MTTPVTPDWLANKPAPQTPAQVAAGEQTPIEKTIAAVKATAPRKRTPTPKVPAASGASSKVLAEFAKLTLSEKLTTFEVVRKSLDEQVEKERTSVQSLLDKLSKWV